MTASSEEGLLALVSAQQRRGPTREEAAANVLRAHEAQGPGGTTRPISPRDTDMPARANAYTPDKRPVKDRLCHCRQSARGVVHVQLDAAGICPALRVHGLRRNTGIGVAARRRGCWVTGTMTWGRGGVAFHRCSPSLKPHRPGKDQQRRST